MKSPLRKRFKRDLKAEKSKYAALFLFLTLAIGLISGFLVADNSMQKSYEESFKKYNIEDGHFILANKAGKSLINKIEDEGVRTEKLFYKDVPAGSADEHKSKDAGSSDKKSTEEKDKSSANNKTVRVFKERKNVNKVCLMEGRLPEKDDEIALDRLFCKNNDLKTGDEYTIDGKRYTITGLIAMSDYSALFKNNTDMMFDSVDFTVAIATDKAFSKMDHKDLKYCYTWKYKDRDLTDKEKENVTEDMMDVIREKAEDQAKALAMRAMMKGEDPKKAAAGAAYLSDLVPRESNQAIQFTGEDMGADEGMMTIMLYVIMVVLAFIFGVTAKSTIEQEAKSIGTLRASGYTKGEMLRHYMTLPVTVSFMGAVVGNIIGYTFMKYYMADLYYNSYSLPKYKTIWNGEAFIQTTVIPMIIIIVVTFLVLSRALRLSPLQFLRGELKKNKKGKVTRLSPKMKFLTRFRIRVIFQNIPAYLIMFFGILLANLIVFFGMLFMPLLDNFESEVHEAKIADYQYVLKAPVESDVKGAEKYATTALKEYGDDEIVVFGIEKNTDYLKGLRKKSIFKNAGKKGGDSNVSEVIASDSYLKKYDYDVGDTIKVDSKFGDEKYKFKIVGSYYYPAALTLFMPIDDFREKFDEDDDYFNGYFSDRKLKDIDKKYISSKITTDDLTLISKQLRVSFGSVLPMFSAFAIILYLILIYMLAKVVLDKNAGNISMVKILGYDNREAGRLYSFSTAFVVMFSVVVTMPLVHMIMSALYRLIMFRMRAWVDMYVAPWLYPVIIVGGILMYGIIYLMQMRKIRKISMAIALKDME